MKKRIFIYTVIALFTILFVYTGVNKLLANEEFNVELKLSPILNPFAGILRWLVPIVELLIVASLLTKRGRLNGLYAAFIMMLLFTLYIVWVNSFSYYIPCGCGGFLEKLSANMHIFLNALFILLALTGIYFEIQERKKRYKI
jgi:uncharacterized membrane protein YphA (DoxX/SURF4 family)